MHPRVYRKYEEILSKIEVKGKILEIGSGSLKATLLTSKCLDSADEKIGIDVRKSSESKDFRIIKGNANKMDMFEDENFDCILCNAMLEHDKYFWKTISEIKRILKKKGLLIISTPSYTNFKFQKLFQKLGKFFKNNLLSDFFSNTTICFRMHSAHGDYYRYSEKTFKEVFFEGFQDVVIETMLLPPRTIGYGFKK